MPQRKMVGKKVYLSPIEEADVSKWVTWLNDLEVAIPLGDEAYSAITERGMQMHFVNACERREHSFSIHSMEDDRALGRCLLFSVDHVNRTGNLGIFIGEKDCWGQGLGTEAITLLLDYAFNLLNLNNVMLGSYSFNERAIHCYRSLGFKEIGRRRQSRVVGGRAYDSVLMDLLASEFLGDSQVKAIMESM